MNQFSKVEISIQWDYCNQTDQLNSTCQLKQYSQLTKLDQSNECT